MAAMRRRRPIPKSRTKKPAADCSARVNQARLDDVIMPVFCPTCQNLPLNWKSPLRMLPRGPTQTRFDDAILPVFCPTCQTNEFAQAALDNQERPAMTNETRAPGTLQDVTSRDRPPSKPRIDKEHSTQIVEDAGATADDGRDLAHGEGGSIDLPTQPGDLAKDD
ncbi:hypothetical protein P0R31_12335 [Bradyrhizobium yuanmingense]|uniref:hypothetical protein n=1 Tax=Bradyrhizobium yuanmingense TaxID=108015 RepID=UPI0023B9A3AB|nr:hypothetical protein [Bradyrhizobium yuanmingense]MDF0518020.1 hypothetical protein [Bradyrhizobium yuanmingense]